MEKLKNIHARPVDMNYRKRGTAGGKRGTGQRGEKGENWDNCNSITNKNIIKKLNTKDRRMG